MDRSTCDGRNDGETAQSVLPLRRKRSNRRHELRPVRDASAALPERQARHSALIKTSLGQVQGRSRKSLGQVSDESKVKVSEKSSRFILTRLRPVLTCLRLVLTPDQ